MLTVEFYTHRNQTLFFLHLFNDLFRKDISSPLKIRADLILILFFFWVVRQYLYETDAYAEKNELLISMR